MISVARLSSTPQKRASRHGLVGYLLAGGYAIGQLTLGLLLHPYQTVQQLVEAKLFSWLALMPSIVLAVITVSWRLLIVPVVQTVFTCQATGFVFCQYLEFISNWMTLFMLYWQLLVLYLFFRFWRAFG